ACIPPSILTRNLAFSKLDPPYPFFLSTRPPPPSPTLFPYTTLFRSRPESNSTAGTRRRVSAHREVRSDYLPSRKREVNRNEPPRSEEHTSELQSLRHLVCRLLLEKKKKKKSRELIHCRYLYRDECLH